MHVKYDANNVGAGLKFPRLHFGGFAPRAWRVSAGRLKKKSRFFWLFEAGWPRLSIPPFASEFNNLGIAHEQRKKRNRELRFFSDLGLLKGMTIFSKTQLPINFLISVTRLVPPGCQSYNRDGALRSELSKNGRIYRHIYT